MLVDDRPATQYPRNSALYWSTFQTGLVGLNGVPMPAYLAFRLPIYLPSTRRRRPGSPRSRPGSPKPFSTTAPLTSRLPPSGVGQWGDGPIRAPNAWVAYFPKKSCCFRLTGRNGNCKFAN